MIDHIIIVMTLCAEWCQNRILFSRELILLACVYEGQLLDKLHLLYCGITRTSTYMAWTWHVALSNIKASCKLTTISHPVIDSLDIVLSLLLSLQRVHCSHVWVWVMHDGSVDVRLIPQYRRWSLSRSCLSYTHPNNITQIVAIHSARVGVTKALLINFSVEKIFGFAKITVRFFESIPYCMGVTCSWAAVTPVKYVWDIQ